MIPEEDKVSWYSTHYRSQLNMWFVDIFLIVFYIIIASLVLITIIRNKPSRYISPDITGFPEPVAPKPSQQRDVPGTSAREIQFTNLNCSKCEQLLFKINSQKEKNPMY